MYFSLKLIVLPGCSIRFFESKKRNILKDLFQVLQFLLDITWDTKKVRQDGNIDDIYHYL